MDWFQMFVSSIANVSSIAGVVLSVIILRIARRVKQVRVAYAVIPSIQSEFESAVERLGALLTDPAQYSFADFRLRDEMDSAMARLKTLENNLKPVWRGSGRRTQELIMTLSDAQTIEYADAHLIRRRLVQTLEELKEFRRMEPFEA